MRTKTALLIAMVVAVSGCANRPLNGAQATAVEHEPAPAGQEMAPQQNAPVRDARLAPRADEGFRPRVSCSANVAPEERVELEMVDTLIARDRPYAALAQLEKTGQRNVEYWLRYGQLQAKTGQLARAHRVFEVIIDRCDSPQAQHGLGMVLIKQGDLPAALRALRDASRRLPASADVRNDYGFALLMAGRSQEAEFELITALELENGSGRARQNLAAAYVLTNNQGGLTQLRERYSFTDDELAHARGLANELRRY